MRTASARGQQNSRNRVHNARRNARTATQDRPDQYSPNPAVLPLCLPIPRVLTRSPNSISASGMISPRTLALQQLRHRFRPLQRALVSMLRTRAWRPPSPRALSAWSLRPERRTSASGVPTAPKCFMYLTLYFTIHLYFTTHFVTESKKTY